VDLGYVEGRTHVLEIRWAEGRPEELLPRFAFKDGETALWSAKPNVFSCARTLGYDTALIGRHLPYPRVLGGSLGLAHWRPSVDCEQAGGVHVQWGAPESVGEPRAPGESPPAVLLDGCRTRRPGDPHRSRHRLRACFSTCRFLSRRV